MGRTLDLIRSGVWKGLAWRSFTKREECTLKKPREQVELHCTSEIAASKYRDPSSNLTVLSIDGCSGTIFCVFASFFRLSSNGVKMGVQ
jgi:hypothetical protein